MPAWYRRGLGDRPQTSFSFQAVRISPVLLRHDLPYVAQFGLELMIMILLPQLFEYYYCK